MKSLVFERDKKELLNNKKERNEFINRHPSTIKELTEKGESNPDTLRENEKEDYLLKSSAGILKENVINYAFLTEPKTKSKQKGEDIPQSTDINQDEKKEMTSIKENKTEVNEDDNDQEEEQVESNDEDNEEEEEEMEEEEENQGEDLNQIKRKSLKEDFYLKETEYQSRIDQLEKDLFDEKNKSEIKSPPNNSSTIISELKAQIKSKDKEIKQFTKSNSLQRNQLEALSKNADSKLGAVNYKQILKKKPLLSLADQGVTENTIKLKDKQLANALSLVEILVKDNKVLKSKFNSIGDHQASISLINLKKENEAQLTQRKQQVKELKNKLEAHEQCGKTREAYEQNTKTLRDDIQHLKYKNEDLKQRIKEKEALLLASVTPPEKKTNDSVGNTQKYQPKVILKKRIKSEEDETESIAKAEQIKKIEKLLTPNELNAMKLCLTKANFERIVKCFITWDSFVLSMESKHKNDIKKHLERMNELDEQIEYINSVDNKNEAKKTLYQTQLNECKTNQMTYKKKIDEIQEKIANEHLIVKERDSQIKLLKVKLDTLRNLLKNERVCQVDKKITQYIYTVKNEDNA